MKPPREPLTTADRVWVCAVVLGPWGFWLYCLTRLVTSGA